jgi:Flp pilus assembly protein TadD
VPAIRQIAAVLQSIGRSQEAAQWLLGAAGIDPNDAEVRYALAVCYVALGRRAEANAEYGALCKLDTALATKLYYLLGGR